MIDWARWRVATTEYAGADALCLLWARVAVKWPWAMQVRGLGARDEWRWSGPKVVWRLARYVTCSFQVSSELGEYLRGGHSTRELDGLDALRGSTFFGESGGSSRSFGGGAGGAGAGSPSQRPECELLALVYRSANASRIHR